MTSGCSYNLPETEKDDIFIGSGRDEILNIL